MWQQSRLKAHVSLLQDCILAETSDPETYHSSVPINNKTGSTAFIVPPCRRGNWIVVFVDVFRWILVRVYVSVSGSSGRQQHNSPASFKKIVTFYYRVYLCLLCMVLNTVSSIKRAFTSCGDPLLFHSGGKWEWNRQNSRKAAARLIWGQTDFSLVLDCLMSHSLASQVGWP